MNKVRGKILIVDDEPIKTSVLEDELRAAGYFVSTAENPLKAEPLLKETRFDVVLTDIRMPGQDGLSFLRNLRKSQPKQAVLVMTAFGTVETAVEAMKLGAFDYLQKPFPTEELLLKLARVLRYDQLSRENEALRFELGTSTQQTPIIGRSEAIREVLAHIDAIAETDATVLIEGESGTGKELTALAIHQASCRSSGSFIAVSCAAMPRGLVEAELFGHEAGAFTGARKRHIGRVEHAHGGTLFLDDIDDVPLEVQVKLLRLLQERNFERIGGEKQIQVNIRVIAATKKVLEEMVEADQFRKDLFYRLNVVPLHLPALSERLEDISLLSEHFLKIIALKHNRGPIKITPMALAKLKTHDWPGNIRELEHVLERMAALSKKDVLDEGDVPSLGNGVGEKKLVSLSLNDRDSIELASVLHDVENQMISWALSRTAGNLAKAAQMLGLPRSSLQYKLGKQKSSKLS